MNDITESVKEPESQVAGARKSKVRAALIILGALIVIWAIWYYLESRGHESTDNAFIDGNVVQISPAYPGRCSVCSLRTINM